MEKTENVVKNLVSDKIVYNHIGEIEINVPDRRI